MCVYIGGSDEEAQCQAVLSFSQTPSFAPFSSKSSIGQTRPDHHPTRQNMLIALRLSPHSGHLLVSYMSRRRQEKIGHWSRRSYRYVIAMARNGPFSTVRFSITHMPQVSAKSSNHHDDWFWKAFEREEIRKLIEISKLCA